MQCEVEWVEHGRETHEKYDKDCTEDRFQLPATTLSRGSEAYFRRRAETRRAENISARLGSAWHASVLDEENIAVLKQFYY